MVLTHLGPFVKHWNDLVNLAKLLEQLTKLFFVHARSLESTYVHGALCHFQLAFIVPVALPQEVRTELLLCKKKNK